MVKAILRGLLLNPFSCIMLKRGSDPKLSSVKYPSCQAADFRDSFWNSTTLYKAIKYSLAQGLGAGFWMSTPTPSRRALFTPILWIFNQLIQSRAASAGEPGSDPGSETHWSPSAAEGPDLSPLLQSRRKKDLSIRLSIAVSVLAIHNGGCDTSFLLSPPPCLLCHLDVV